MIKVNEYFNGNVKSLALENSEGNSTVGVMKKGDYEFGTSTVEIMSVVSGSLTVKLPGKSDWKKFMKGDSFTVEANQKFQLKVEEDSAYLCVYK
jgi:uncharacterized protein YaiE (UPF0345 family)